uniref:Large subunit terminase n=1 Tax=Podoviridae sp. ct53O25 TaxID=2826539 RepID=A0A8S5MBA1_9CAUD|nr:MAG TPA: Large subunit terminase [Podoviridae sp. ct53O25]
MAQIVMPTYKPSPTAIKFHTSDEFVRGVIAGVGTGKSVMMIQELLRRGFSQAPGPDGVRRTRMGLVRSTYPNLRLTTIKTFSEWVPPLLAPVKQTAPMTSRFTGGLPDGTRFDMEFVFIALENVQDVQKLKSMEFTMIFINEAREVAFEVFDTCKERVGRFPPYDERTNSGGCTYSGVIFDSNPPGEDHWIAKLDRNPTESSKIFHQPAPFIEKVNEKGEIEYIDNPDAENLEYLNQKPPPEGVVYTREQRRAFGYAYYRRQLDGKPKHYIDTEIMGKYGSNFDGRPVYQEYWADDMVCSYPLEAKYGYPVILGIDTTGLNPAVAFGQLEMGVLQIKHELLALDMPFVPFVRDVLKPFLAQHYPGCQVVAYTDPANPRDSNRGETPVQVLRQYGIQAQNAPTNKFKARLDSVISFLQRRGGLLIDKRCEKIIDGFRGGYHYRPLKISGVGQTFSSEPVKNEFSHLHDAVQYLCNGIRHGSDNQQNQHTYRRSASKRVY